MIKTIIIPSLVSLVYCIDKSGILGPINNMPEYIKDPSIDWSSGSCSVLRGEVKGLFFPRPITEITVVSI